MPRNKAVVVEVEIDPHTIEKAVTKVMLARLSEMEVRLQRNTTSHQEQWTRDCELRAWVQRVDEELARLKVILVEAGVFSDKGAK